MKLLNPDKINEQLFKNSKKEVAAGEFGEEFELSADQQWVYHFLLHCPPTGLNVTWNAGADIRIDRVPGEAWLREREGSLWMLTVNGENTLFLFFLFNFLSFPNP